MAYPKIPWLIIMFPIEYAMVLWGFGFRGIPGPLKKHPPFAGRCSIGIYARNQLYQDLQQQTMVTFGHPWSGRKHTYN